MTDAIIAEIQRSIDRALSGYRGHPDLEDLKQEAWLRLLRAEAGGRFADVRKIAGRAARFAAATYFWDGHGIDADRIALQNRGFCPLPVQDLDESLHPVVEDFAPRVMEQVDWTAWPEWRRLSADDRWLLWQSLGLEVPLSVLAPHLGIGHRGAWARQRRARAKLARGREQDAP